MEMHAMNAQDPGIGRDTCLIDQKTLKLLIKLGDIDELKESIPVCYPYSKSAGQEKYNEKEGFEWFVANSDRKHVPQHLKSINPVSDLPTLKPEHKTMSKVPRE